MAQNKIYDVIIIGGGPAGYTAAIYCARAGLDTVVLEMISAGGQMCLTEKIDNYPGFPKGIDGFTLGDSMRQGAQRFGANTIQAQVLSAKLTGTSKEVQTNNGLYKSRIVIIATGAEHRRLGLEKETALTGKGVGYCAACDGIFFKGKKVAVVGGGNSAAADALLLSRICEKVFLIHRRDSLRAERFYREPLLQAKNITFLWNSEVTELLHQDQDKLTGVKIKNVQDSSEEEIACDGLFISIGRKPVTGFLQGQVALDEGGYILADETTRTSIDGVFAIGDVRTKVVRQIVTATADGAVAAHYAEAWVEK